MLVLAAAASAFIGLIGEARTQAKIVESNESMVGLEILRRDIESAGYGLFWSWNTAQIAYQEAAIDPLNAYASYFNDSPNAPKAIVSMDTTVYSGGNTKFNGSHYLVIKSMSVARNIAGEKWTYVTVNGANQWFTNTTTIANENFQINDRVIALEIRDPTTRGLVTGASFYTTFTGGNPPFADTSFVPLDPNDAYVVYGIDSLVGGTPRSPFNRADYFISNPQGTDVLPDRCAPNTGILYKATMNQTTGQFSLQSLLDCVADLQVVYWVDQTGTGTNFTETTGIWPNGALPLTNQQIRTQVKQVGVYVLTHEGRQDLAYTFPTNAPNDIYVGEPPLNGRWYTLNQTAAANQLHYRWKVYQMLIKPLNLGS